MKPLSVDPVLLLLFAALAFACSNDDNQLPDEQFLTAIIVSEKISMNSSSGKIHCEKILADYSAIDLLVKAESHSGKNIEFRILNYRGKGRYSFGDNPLNKSWITYSEASPPALWSAPYHIHGEGTITNRMDITEDDDHS